MEHAEKGNLYLRVIRDSDPCDPRDYNNLGTMYCWHNRMNLGDPCPHESSREALIELAKGVVTPIDIFRPDQIMYYRPERNDVDESGLCLSPTEDFDAFTWTELREIASNVNVMLPIYLYDHSGITISTSAFSCRWDSGLVGFIFCSHERFLSETGYTAEELFNNNAHRVPVVGDHVWIDGRNECGKVVATDGDTATIDFDYGKSPDFRKPENVRKVWVSEITSVMASKAAEMLKSEVETYDQYLTGEVFGIEYGTIEEKTWVCKETGEEETEREYNKTESVWGFYGDDHVNSGLMDNLPDAYKELVPLLEECDDED